MKISVSKISLRTRLLLMTTFAFLALVIAVLSAYRTTRTSAFYAERQASGSVGAGAREFLRGTKDAEIFGKDGKLEKTLIEKALRDAHDNRTEAAQKLEISRRLLYDKIKEHYLKTD